MKLSGSVLAALVVTVPALSVLAGPPALGAVATCHGRAATLVGTPHETLTGTEGPDVIVTNGGKDVDARGGDDLICVTHGTYRVQAGSGNDVVDTTASTRSTNVVLGSGDDTFTGGDHPSKVVAGESRTATADDGADRIRTGAGDDAVWSGSSGAVNADAVNVGGGDDAVAYFGTMAPARRLGLGAGRNALSLSPDQDGTYKIDTSDESLTLDGRPRMTWNGHVRDLGFVNVPFDPGYAGTLVVRGSSRAERLMVIADQFRTVARMGGGNDVVAPWNSSKPGNVFVGGAGSDTIAPEMSVRPDARPTLSLRDEVIEYDDPARPDARLKTFENIRFNGQMSITVIGNDSDNRVLFQGCQISFSGLGGDDLFLSEPVPLGCAAFNTVSLLRGGPGHDVLYGQTGDDTIIGGAGPDVAYGRGGDDTCSAERTKDCER